MEKNRKQKNIFLLRHGDIGLNGEKRFIGLTDLPLSQQGIQRGKYLKARFANIMLTKIYCSDLVRSVQTAEIIGKLHKITPEIRTELREMSLGEWENQTFQEISLKYPEEFKRRGENISNYRTPGGESFTECFQRVMPFFKGLLTYEESDENLEENILIVGHAGINRTVLTHMLGRPLTDVLKLKQDYGCVNLLTVSEQGNYLKILNSEICMDLPLKSFS